jgi:hypothetical protein
MTTVKPAYVLSLLNNYLYKMTTVKPAYLVISIKQGVTVVILYK